jgi:6-pyruvoyltetrahydropterin/6-carboxytetrahydropterin synthase
MFRSTKTYGNEIGLSATFRQHKAESHCRFLHGYALGFRFIFEATHLDKNNWVVDFGGLKELKKDLQEQFDHKLIVADDDPFAPELFRLAKMGLAQPTFMKNTGCEAFAQWAYWQARLHVDLPRVRVVSAECFEHSGNSGIYMGEVE